MYRNYIVALLEKITQERPLLNKIIRVIFKSITKGKYILFIHKSDRLFNTLKYINANEAGRNVLILHCKDESDEINKTVWEELKTLVPLIPKAGVFSHLHLELEQIEGEFSPELIDNASKKYNIPKNRIFIGTIHHHHKFAYEDLGGVRIIV